MKVDVFNITFHRVRVQLDEDELEVGRSVYGRQTVQVAAETQEAAVAAVVTGDAVLEGIANALQGVEVVGLGPNEVDPELAAKVEALTAENAKLTEELEALNNQKQPAADVPPAV